MASACAPKISTATSNGSSPMRWRADRIQFRSLREHRHEVELQRAPSALTAVQRQFPQLSEDYGTRIVAVVPLNFAAVDFEDTVRSAWGGNGRGLLLLRIGISTTSV